MPVFQSTPSIMLITILLFTLALHTFSAFQVANFPQIFNRVKTGDHKAVTSRLPPGNSTSLPQDYFRTFGSIPNVAIGIMIFEVQAGNNLGFTVSVGSVSTTGFTSVVTALTDTYINQLTYTYVAVQVSQIFGVFLAKTYTGLPITAGQMTNTVPVGRTINTAHQYIVKPFLKDFSLSRANNDLSIKLTATLLGQSSQFSITLLTNSTVSSVSYYIFYIDKTALQQTQQYFIDAGSAYSEYRVNSLLDFSVQPSIFNYYNFMRGLNWLAFNTSNASLFSIKIDSFPFATVSAYRYGMSSLLHWRNRQCPNSSYYYLQQQTKCYDTCPSGYANNNANKYCQKCDYKCKQCLSDGTTCTSCSNYTITHRGPLSSGQCLCQNGYYDVGNNNDTCQICHYTCTTCVDANTKCTTCDSTRDYDNTTNVCACKIRMYDPLNGSPVCQPCHYSCQTCSSSTSTSCLSCSPTSNRILTSNSCLCRSTFSQSTPPSQSCTPNPTLSCNTNCQTCSQISTNCTSCTAVSVSKRQLVNNFCKCISGYQSSNSVDRCTQICGDGVRYQVQCDDGNTNDGDGCSSACGVQDGYRCDSGNGPNVCVYTAGYTINKVSMNKREDSNVLDIVFSIQPPPPPSSVPSLSLQSLTILSSSVSPVSPQTTPPSSLLSLVVSYSQSIPQNTITSLSLSSIGTSQPFPVQSDNKLSLVVYPTQSYTAYKVFQVLVYIYLALFWLGVVVFSIVISVVSKQEVLGLGQFVNVVGLVAVGVAGFENYGVFYKGIDYIKYVYGYNAQVKGQDGLFAYANYGLLFLLLPYIAFGIYSLITKLKPSLLIPNLQTRKYLLLQLPFLYFIYYSILICSSLMSQLKTNSTSTALSITSIIFGIIYLIVLVLMSVYFYRKSDIFGSVTARMLSTKGPIFYIGVTIWAQVVLTIVYFAIAYGAYTTSKKYAGLSATAFSIVVLVIAVLVRPYQNNIRIIVNWLTIGISYFCYFLVNQLSASQWSAFVILAVLYVHMIYNYANICVALYRVNRRKQMSQSSESEEKDSQSQANYGGEMDADGEHIGNSNLKIGEFQEPNKVDLDFDPNKQIAESRMDTLKKQVKYQSIRNPYAVQNYGSPTVRKHILDQDSGSAI